MPGRQAGRQPCVSCAWCFRSTVYMRMCHAMPCRDAFSMHGFVGNVVYSYHHSHLLSEHIFRCRCFGGSTLLPQDHITKQSKNEKRYDIKHARCVAAATAALTAAAAAAVISLSASQQNASIFYSLTFFCCIQWWCGDGDGAGATDATSCCCILLSCVCVWKTSLLHDDIYTGRLRAFHSSTSFNGNVCNFWISMNVHITPDHIR